MSRIDPQDDAGYTLIELLMATAAALVLAAASLALVVASSHLSSTYTDRVDANQTGRIAMERVVQALHSSCVSPAITPVIAASSATSLSFYSALTAGATVNPNKVTVAYTGGAITMLTQPWASGTDPSSWTFSGGTTTTLVPHAAQATLNGTQLPVFQYFGYGGGTSISTTALTVPLSSTDAAATAMVTVSFESLPSSANSNLNRAADLSNSVVLRLSPASNSASVSNGPCA